MCVGSVATVTLNRFIVQTIFPITFFREKRSVVKSFLLHVRCTSSTSKKAKLTGSERSKRWRDKNGNDFKKAESIKVERRCKSRIAEMSRTELARYRSAAAERKRKSRLLKRQKEIENAGNPSTETSNGNESLPTKHQPFRRPQSYGKAIKMTIRSLPQSPRKRKAVVRGLTKRFCVDLHNEMEASMSAEKSKGISSEVKDAVRNFYLRSDISYTMPGLKDEMTVWINGKKERLRKHYLTMFLREAFAVFDETHPEINLGFSTFCRLRPGNVLLLKNTPKDQCKCKTHENFRMKLTALNCDILPDKDCWQAILCETNDLQSSWWTGTCETCR